MNPLTLPNFREFYFENHLLKETPYLIGKQLDQNLNEPGYNYKTGLLITSKGRDSINDFSKINLVSGVKFFNHIKALYKDISEDIIQDWWLGSDGYVNALFKYRLQNNEMYSVYVWSFRQMPSGFARWLIINYYLKQYSAVISDIAHTPEGCNFWKNLVEDCKETHKITVLIGEKVNSAKEESIDLNNIDQYWSKKAVSRIKIYA
jgi:hypothetical protein